jgi:hypothetical protein
MKDKLLTFIYLLWIMIIFSIFIISMLNYKNNYNYDSSYPRNHYIYPRNKYKIIQPNRRKNKSDHQSDSIPSYAKNHTKGYYKVKQSDDPHQSGFAKGRYIDHSDRQESQKAIDALEKGEEKDIQQAILNSYWEQYINY